MELILAAVVSALLMIEVLILIPMVPRGPIETRSFAHLPGVVFWGFNVFLTSLGLASFVIAAAVLGAATWAFWAAAALGVAYMAVFGLDLAGIFPKSPDPLPTPLLMLEVIDLAIAGAIIVVAAQGIRI